MTKNRKIISAIIAVIFLVTGIGGAVIYRNNQTGEIVVETATEYQSQLKSILNDVRSGQERWNAIFSISGGTGNLGTGSIVGFQDLCTGYYSNLLRILGTDFVKQAETFEGLKIENGNPATEIQNYQEYQAYFGTYKTIGTKLIEFADYVDATEYEKAIEVIENLLELYDQLPILV
jgi:hypothetical protein